MEKAMVSAGMGAMGSLLVKLATLLGGEYRLLKGVRKQVEFLSRELSSMHALLETLASKERLEPLEKDWKNKVRELSYDIEDCIDLFMHRFRNGDAKAGFMKKTTRRLKTLWETHDIATQIKELKDRVVEERQRRDRYKLDTCISNRGSALEIDPRVPALYTEANGLVAIDGPRDEIIALLMDEKVELKAVSIVGCGGLGKTTLAMEVYRKIRGDFQCRVSVSVSRTLDTKKLLKDMLYQLDQNEYNKSKLFEVEQLLHKFRHILTGKRYFIILDDIWTIQAWLHLKSILPECGNGSRIIITTRSTQVANSCSSNFNNYVYNMRPLSDADSRSLFLKRIFYSGQTCPSHLDETCNKIIKKCGGLPLAINSIASLLASKSEDQGEWEKVKDSIGSTDENGCALEVMNKILLLSYYDLPLHLKSCLLYLTVFPEDYTIKREKLIWRWIAEGLITEQNRRSMECVAEDCFTELINRNMIQAVKVMYDGRAEACRVHDVMLDLIISLSVEENFVAILPGHGTSRSAPEKIRWLSMLPNYSEEGGIRRTMIYQSNVRSLSINGSPKQTFHLLDFRALRVLDIEGCEWLANHHLHSIGNLFQLKYLRVANGNIQELPDQIGNLQYLETLDVARCREMKRLPATIVRLRNLVRLFAASTVTFPDDIGSMRSLQELSGLSIENSGSNNLSMLVEQLGQLTKMRDLVISCSGLDESSREVLLLSLSLLDNRNLRSLSIDCDDSVLCSLISDQHCSLPHIQKLNILKNIPKIPKGVLSLRNLAKLRMLLCTMEEEGLDILSAMPTLLYLDVMFMERPKQRLVISSQGFKYLKVFKLDLSEPGSIFRPAMPMLDLGGTGLFFEPCAMPNLQRLHIGLESDTTNSIENLGLEHLSSLRHLSVIMDGSKISVDEVEAAMRKLATRHPDCPTLQINKDWDTEDEFYFGKNKIRRALYRFRIAHGKSV